jgi:L-lactate dehydrogenase complex protein LldF
MFLGMKAANFAFASAARFRLAQRLGRFGLRLFTGKDGWIHRLPGLGARWTMSRDLRALPEQTFRDWWATRPAKATRPATATRDARPTKEGR